jgi:hypothetical protein
MADLSFTPTFRHTIWVDNVDRVGAEGPNGMNVRFQEIESDLNQVSTVVAQIGGEIDRIRSVITPPPSSVQTRLVFTPVLQAVPGNGIPWVSQGPGVPGAQATVGGPNVVGAMNLALPNGVRLTSLVGHGSSGNVNGGAGTVNLSLNRLPLKPTIPAATATTLATASASTPGLWNPSSPAIPANLAVVDLSAFRYVFTATLVPRPGNADSAFLDTIEIVFTPA